MALPRINFEGSMIPISELPAGSIRLDGIWYLDPTKIPDEYKAQKVRLSAFGEEVAKNGGVIPPDVREAVTKQAEETKKKIQELRPKGCSTC